MSLSDLASLGSFVSGVAVLASLVFLFFQMRQMTEQVKQAEKNQQASIRQAKSTRQVEISLRATDRSLCEALVKCNSGTDDVPDVELLQYYNFWQAAFWDWEDAFFQNKDGLLTDAGLQAVRNNMHNMLGNMGVRALWRIHRAAASQEFVPWVDALIAEASPLSGRYLREAWRTALAADRQ